MTSSPIAGDRLHAEIMNIPGIPERHDATFVLGYKMGHRDARHAAAEIVAAATDHTPSGVPQPQTVAALASFDEAVAAELPCVSTVEYNSHEICKWFAENVRKRLSGSAESKKGE